jgi:hypothetical protein
METKMNTKQLFTLSAIILLMTFELSAQQTSVRGTTLSYNVNILDYSDCSCDYLPVQMASSNLGISYGHQAGSRIQMSHTINYSHHDKGFRGFFDLGGEDEVILHSHNYSYNISADLQLNERWNARGYFKPQVRSYLEENGRNFYADFEGGLMFNYNAGTNWQFGGGIAYTRTLSEKLVHPVLFAEYDNHSNFRTTIYFPQYAEAWFTPGDRFGLGIEAVLSGDEFTGRETVFKEVKTSVQYADFTVGPAAEYHISNFISLNVKAAYTAGRHLVIESADSRESLKPSPVWGFKAGIQLRLP